MESLLRIMQSQESTVLIQRFIKYTQAALGNNNIHETQHQMLIKMIFANHTFRLDSCSTKMTFEIKDKAIDTW
jgi:hypothetical protein